MFDGSASSRRLRIKTTTFFELMKINAPENEHSTLASNNSNSLPFFKFLFSFGEVDSMYSFSLVIVSPAAFSKVLRSIHFVAFVSSFPDWPPHLLPWFCFNGILWDSDKHVWCPERDSRQVRAGSQGSDAHDQRRGLLFLSLAPLCSTS